jgi:RND family efflux transporter MFP subunit
MQRKPVLASGPAAISLLAVSMLCTPSISAAPPVVAVCRPAEYDAADHEFVGRLEPLDAIEIRTPGDGVVRSVAVQPGAAVRKGDVLLECDWSATRASSGAESSLLDAGEGVTRLASALDQARKLSESAPDQLAKEYQGALDGLKAPLDKAVTELGPLLKDAIPPGRRDDLRATYAAIDRALRLCNARNSPGLDTCCEDEIAQLRPAVARTLRSMSSAKLQPATAQVVSDFKGLLQGIDKLLLLSHARTKEGLDALSAKRDLAAANLKVVRSNVESLRRLAPPARIVAPTDGRVIRVAIRTGDRVEATSRAAALLCVIAPTAEVRVVFEMDETCVETLGRLLRSGKLLAKSLTEVGIRLALPGEEGFPHPGKLAFVDTQPDPNSKRVRCRAEFSNAGGTLTDAAFAAYGKGKRVRVRLTLGESKTILLVPRQSVLTDEAGKTQVLVLDAKNRVELRPVRAGAEYGGLREVTEGLRTDDWVVVCSDASRKNAGGTELVRGEFARDFRLLDLKPGTVVEPLHIPLPEQDSAEPPK